MRLGGGDFPLTSRAKALAPLWLWRVDLQLNINLCYQALAGTCAARRRQPIRPPPGHACRIKSPAAEERLGFRVDRHRSNYAQEPACHAGQEPGARAVLRIPTRLPADVIRLRAPAPAERGALPQRAAPEGQRGGQWPGFPFRPPRADRGLPRPAAEEGPVAAFQDAPAKPPLRGSPATRSAPAVEVRRYEASAAGALFAPAPAE